MKNEIIFDVETKKLFSDIQGDNPGDLGISVVSLYKRTVNESGEEIEGEISSFWEKDFKNMWPLFQNADRIIGFNTLHFDVPALAPHANFPFSKLPHFDIMVHVKKALGRRIGLNAIAQETLDVQKTDNGLNAVFYWRKGDKISLEKLQKYCEDDVIITKDIYDFGFKNKYLKYKDKWNTVRDFEVDFFYPKDNSIDQIGLF